MQSTLRKYWPALLIFVLAVFFRFYRFSAFQFWSVDDENFAAGISRLFISHHWSLILQNTVLEVSLGPFFYFISVAIFWLSHLNPWRVDIFASALGVIVALLVTKVGWDVGGKRVGLLAGALYAASFMMAFFDRRWWVLSLDPLLAVVAVWSVYKINRGRYYYFLPLAIAGSFAWHSDPTILVVILFAFLVWLLGLIPRFHNEYWPGIIYLLFSMSPLAYFELRHPGAISGPAVKLLGRLLHFGSGPGFRLDISAFADSLVRGFFVQPTSSVESYLIAYCRDCPRPPLPILAELVVGGLLILPLVALMRGGFPGRTRVAVKMLYLYTLSFLLGILVFSSYSEGYIHQHYFVILWPILFLISGLSLSWLFAKRWSVAVVLFLVAFFLVNLQTLLTARMRYPLTDKMAAADYIKSVVPQGDFGLKVDDDQRKLEGLGGILFLSGFYPKNASYYTADWIYQAYSLYGTSPGEKISKLAVVSPFSSRFPKYSPHRFGNIMIIIGAPDLISH